MKPFKEITIIGMGLIGGSIALAIKNSHYKGKIIGYDLSSEALKEGKNKGAIDVSTKNIQEAVKTADLIILATPVGYYDEILREIAPILRKNTIVTDVGSVKGYVIDMVERHLPRDVEFVGGHPMAGSEKGGIKAATPFLFENAYYFLTPRKNTSQRTIEKISSLVKSIGAYPVVIDSKEHDKIVAQISHIPHLSAVLLANMLEKRESISYIPFVGGGFRDSTRIASGNPNMWKDIFFLNKKEIVNGIETLEEMLREFKEKLIGEESEKILKSLENAKKIRDTVPHSSSDYIPPLYELIIDVEDRPGVLAELTQIIGENCINIKEIEILHAREENGAVRIGLESKEEQKKALNILKKGGFPLTYIKGEDEENA